MPPTRDTYREFHGHKDIGPDMGAWCDWLRAHGIVPDIVPVDGWIARDVENRRIRYLAFVLDDNGKHQVNPNNPLDVWAEERHVLLEREPLPFPVP